MALMLYGFVRVGAAVGMRVREFEDEGEHANLVLHEKGGKERRIACHHKTREYLRAAHSGGGFRAAREDCIVSRWSPGDPRR